MSHTASVLCYDCWNLLSMRRRKKQKIEENVVCFVSVAEIVFISPALGCSSFRQRGFWSHSSASRIAVALFWIFSRYTDVLFPQEPITYNGKGFCLWLECLPKTMKHIVNCAHGAWSFIGIWITKKKRKSQVLALILLKHAIIFHVFNRASALPSVQFV